MDRFLNIIDLFLFEALPPKLRKVYEIAHSLESYRGFGWTPKGYIGFLNNCACLKEITGLPFSLEENFGGLPSRETWNEAVEASIRNWKGCSG